MTRTLLPPLHDMIAQLVSIPSVSSVNPQFDMSNRAVCSALAQWFEDLGCSVDMILIPGDRQNYNIIARYGHGPAGLALCGHTDTVPYDEKGWQYDPLGGKIVDQRLYGVGSTDMKGFLALCAKVIETIPVSALDKSVLFIATADEESSMDGARFLVESGFELPQFCVVGEPTDLIPIRQHKGIIMERVEVVGRSGHSSNPALGANAIEGMQTIITTLAAFTTEMAETFHDDSFDVPVPTFNCGYISGGDNPNRICGKCTLDFDLRLMPGMSVDSTRAQLRKRLLRELEGSSFELQFKTLFQGANPLQTPTSSTLLRACEKHSGRSSIGVNFCTEGPFYTELGAETMIIGPGSINVAHQANEFLPLDVLPSMGEIIEKLIYQFCQNSA